MLFNEENPESQFMIDPTYLPDDKKHLAAWLGFKQTGERNALGKVIRYIPGVGRSTRMAAERKFGNMNVDTFLDNVNDNRESDTAAATAGAGVGIAAAGIASQFVAPGNPLGLSAIQQGGKMAMMGSGGVGAGGVDLSDDWGSTFHMMADGGEMGNWWEGSEDLAMIDKESGKHVGDISYGERVMSKQDNAKMKELKAKGDFDALGEFVAAAMDRQPDYSQKLKKGGTLSPEKAKKILADGTVYGRPITEKQRKYFEYIAAGGDPEKRKSGVNQYAGGGPIVKPIVVDSPTDPRLQAYNDSMYLYNRSVALDKWFSANGVNPNVLDSNYINPVQAMSDPAPFQRLGYPSPAATKQLPIAGTSDVLDFPLYTKPKQPVMLKTNIKQGSEVLPYAGGAEIIDMGGGRSYISPADVFKTIGNAVGGPEQLFNISQFLIGMGGTKGQTPQFQKPEAWDEFLMELRRDAMHGFSNAEAGDVKRGNERALTTGLNFARETSGGNGAFAVGDASRFAGDYMDRGLKLASANSAMKRQSQSKYGTALQYDIAMDKEDFARRYSEDLMKKSAAADLANTGLQSVINQVDFNKNYGPGSINEQYLQSLIELNKNLSGIDYSGWLPGLKTKAAPVEPQYEAVPATPMMPKDEYWFLDQSGFPQSRMPIR